MAHHLQSEALNTKFLILQGWAMNDLFLLGRIIFGGFFTCYGVNHFLNTAEMIQYTAAKGVPMPELAAILSGALIIVGGLSVLLGLWPHVGAACIAVFLIGVSPIENGV